MRFLHISGSLTLSLVTFWAVVKPTLPPAFKLVVLAEVWVAVFAGSSDEVLVAAFEDKNDGDTHSDTWEYVVNAVVCEIRLTVDQRGLVGEIIMKKKLEAED